MISSKSSLPKTLSVEDSVLARKPSPAGYRDRHRTWRQIDTPQRMGRGEAARCTPPACPELPCCSEMSLAPPLSPCPPAPGLAALLVAAPGDLTVSMDVWRARRLNSCHRSRPLALPHVPLVVRFEDRLSCLELLYFG